MGRARARALESGLLVRRSSFMRARLRIRGLFLLVGLVLVACESSRVPAQEAHLPDAPASTDGATRTSTTTTLDASTEDASLTTNVAADAGSSSATCNGVTLPKSVARLGCAKEDSDVAGRPAGYSSDGAFLGACVSACDPCPLACSFRGNNGASRAFSDFYAPSNPKVRAVEASRLSDEEKEKRIAALEVTEHASFEKSLAALALTKGPPGRPLSGPFPYLDLALASKGEVSPRSGEAILSFGAAVDGEDPVYPIRIALAPHPMWNGPLSLDPKVLAKLDAAGKKKLQDETRAELRSQFGLSEPELVYVDVSKDGSELGVVAFVTGPMWYESARETRTPLRGFVAKIYEETATRREKRGDAAGALALRDKARALGK